MRRFRQYLFINAILLMLFILHSVSSADVPIMSSANWAIKSDVISGGGGGPISSASYTVSFVLAESVIGSSQTTTHLYAGFKYAVSNPFADTDGDGLTNNYELTTIYTGGLKTEWQVADTDGDGINDGAEVAYGTNPTNSGDVPYSIVPSLVRTDGGSSMNNLVSNGTSTVPKLDVEYDFIATVKDLSGTPKHVKLFLTQRTSPTSSDFYAYDLVSSCSGNFNTGAVCKLTTKLGPAAVHKFYLELKAADNTIIATGNVGGPVVELLNGYTMIGAARELVSSSLTGTAAFGSDLSYRWASTGLTTDSNKGAYELMDGGGAPARYVKTGEGYFVKRISTPVTLNELNTYSDVASGYTVTLSPGWNIISNPFIGNVKLADVKVLKGSIEYSWLAAAGANYVLNAIYYYQGSDWGGTYTFEAAGGSPEATLIPWWGYWVYLKKDDAVYKLVIPKP